MRNSWKPGFHKLEQESKMRLLKTHSHTSERQDNEAGKVRKKKWKEYVALRGRNKSSTDHTDFTQVHLPMKTVTRQIPFRLNMCMSLISTTYPTWHARVQITRNVLILPGELVGVCRWKLLQIMKILQITHTWHLDHTDPTRRASAIMKINHIPHLAKKRVTHLHIKLLQIVQILQIIHTHPRKAIHELITVHICSTNMCRSCRSCRSHPVEVFRSSRITHLSAI